MNWTVRGNLILDGDGKPLARILCDERPDALGQELASFPDFVKLALGVLMAVEASGKCLYCETARGPCPTALAIFALKKSGIATILPLSKESIHVN